MKKWNPLTRFSDFYPSWKEVFPVRDEAEFQRMAKRGHAPKFVRFGSQRSPAWYRKSEVLDFATRRWGVHRPDLIQELLDLGFGDGPDESAPEKSVKVKAKKASES